MFNFPADRPISRSETVQWYMPAKYSIDNVSTCCSLRINSIIKGLYFIVLPTYKHICICNALIFAISNISISTLQMHQTLTSRTSVYYLSVIIMSCSPPSDHPKHPRRGSFFPQPPPHIVIVEYPYITANATLRACCKVVIPAPIHLYIIFYIPIHSHRQCDLLA